MNECSALHPDTDDSAPEEEEGEAYVHSGTDPIHKKNVFIPIRM